MIQFKTAIPFLVLLVLIGSCSPKTSAEMQATSNGQQDQNSSSSQQAASPKRQDKVSVNGPTGETLESTSGSQITR